jgi:hypothetical protein
MAAAALKKIYCRCFAFLALRSARDHGLLLVSTVFELLIQGFVRGDEESER